MTHVLNIGPSDRSRDFAGILCVLVGMTFFVGQDALMKVLLGPYTVWLLMAVRGVVAVLILVPLILILARFSDNRVSPIVRETQVAGGLPVLNSGLPEAGQREFARRGRHRLLTPLWPLHLLRGALFALGFSLFYSAFPFMGLAEVSTIFFAAPLITGVLAVVFLGERIGIHRMAALGIGFVGVLVAMAPDGDAFTWVAVMPLLCAVMYSAGQVLARVIGDRETTLTTGLYTILFSSVLVLPLGWGLNQVMPMQGEFAHLGWSLPGAGQHDWPRLILLGAVGMAGYLLLSRAYQIAPASLVAPFDYSYLPMATVMAWLLWAELPGQNTWIGMVLIVGSGLYLGYRELLQSRRAVAPPPTAEAVYTPGNPVAHISIQGQAERR